MGCLRQGTNKRDSQEEIGESPIEKTGLAPIAGPRTMSYFGPIESAKLCTKVCQKKLKFWMGESGSPHFERRRKMKQKLTIVFLSILLCSLPGLSGCKDSGQEEAVAEAAAAKTELSKIKTELAGIIGERDNLKLELATVIEARDKLQAMVEAAKNINEQVAGLAKERDGAIAELTEVQGTVEELKSQLAEQMQKVVGLEGQNMKLREMIDELKKNLGSEIEIPPMPRL